MRILNIDATAEFWYGSKTIIHEKTNDNIEDFNIKSRLYSLWERLEEQTTADKTCFLDFKTREMLTPNPLNHDYCRITTALRQPTNGDWYDIRFKIDDEDHHFKLTANRPIVVKRQDSDYVLTTPDHLQTSDKLYYANIYASSVNKKMEKYWPDHIIEKPEDIIKATGIMNNYAELEPVEIADITIQSSNYSEPKVWPHEPYMHLCYDYMTNSKYFVIDNILVPNKYQL